ncbi:hypothetical protein ASD39_01475 [Sphingomonas sp. Root50]|nr:hypothetical protein ASD17_00280 [Sphingomonas sp. Root1294]KQY69410.1 hypothetical protein ASD39_01475 [Sphingomonas sp. Root50]KRB89820.1 hypothetical protein ASE22_16390 [Sphingomonas sp. Root720]
MGDSFALDDIAHTIQLAMAPCFLLTAIGAILNMLTGRLGRVVDRSRWIEQNFTAKDDPRHGHQVQQLRWIDERMRHANRALVLCTISAVLICIVIAGLFTAVLFDLALAQPIAIVFVLAMLLLIVGLGIFLYEVRIAVHATRIQDELLERDDR